MPPWRRQRSKADAGAVHAGCLGLAFKNCKPERSKYNNTTPTEGPPYMHPHRSRGLLGRPNGGRYCRSSSHLVQINVWVCICVWVRVSDNVCVYVSMCESVLCACEHVCACA